MPVSSTLIGRSNRTTGNPRSDKIIKRVLALALVVTGLTSGILATPTADAAAGTPDGYTIYDNGSHWWHTGTIMWNDYADDDHSRDLDDIWVHDVAGDGKTVTLWVRWPDGSEEDYPLRDGQTRKIYLWNPRKGEKVFFKACNPNPGAGVSVCWGWKYFRE